MSTLQVSNIAGNVAYAGISTQSKALNMAKGAAVVSAATTDIWTPGDGNTLHVTGVASITSFGTAPQAGVDRWVIADGAFTITNNANIKVQGGANYTATVDDVFHIIADTTTTVYVEVFKANGQAIVLSGRQYASQPFTASGTFTTPANSTTSTVYHYRLLGAGGGGGGTNGSGATGGGGGAGAFAEGTFTGVAPSTAISITIGAPGTAGTTAGTSGATGGSSTIGSPVSITAGGGVGGVGSTLSSSPGASDGGGGGVITGSPNIANMPGGHGGRGTSNSSFPVGGNGANSPLGAGGVGAAAYVGQTPTSATGFGSGGGGSIGSGWAGSDGTGGFCAIDWVL